MNTYKVKAIHNITDEVRELVLEAVNIEQAVNTVNSSYHVRSIMKLPVVLGLTTSITNNRTKLSVCNYSRMVHNDIIEKYNDILMISPFKYKYKFYAYGDLGGSNTCVHADEPEALSHLAYDEWDLDDPMMLNGVETTIREFNDMMVFMSERSCSWSALVSTKGEK